VPLAISTGAGANSRHAIGTGVIGGMLAATFIATIFIPMFFVLVMGANTWVRKHIKLAKGKREVAEEK
jgi:multidrug efflux pump